MMKRNLISILVLSLVLGLHAEVLATDKTAAERVEDLRVQLIETQTREEALRIRGQQLDEALKPENIERALVGIGSTKPEELREYRRRQLMIERESVSAQLKILEINRTRLEAAIATTEAKAYQESPLLETPPIQMVSVDPGIVDENLIVISYFLRIILLLGLILLAAFGLTRTPAVAPSNAPSKR